jgi:hypothetical protein
MPERVFDMPGATVMTVSRSRRAACAAASLCAVLFAAGLVATSTTASASLEAPQFQSHAPGEPLQSAASDLAAEENDADIATEHNHHWFTVRGDPRLCPSPLCGGYWVTRVNRPFTACANGTQAASCYVSDVDFSASGLSAEQQQKVRSAAGHLLLRGSIQTREPSPFGVLGVFRAKEAWIGHARATPSGVFYRARSTSIVCITFPCPIAEVVALNHRSRPAMKIAGVKLGGVSSDARDGYQQLNTPQGLLTAGDLVPVSGPAGNSYELQSTEYYVPVAPELELDLCGGWSLRTCLPDEFCRLTDDADCGRADQGGTCEVRPQACLALYDPVCGCDGVTYSNECVANAAGVSVDYKGPCR